MTTPWLKPCSDSACVETQTTEDVVYVRNSTRPDVVVEFDREEWAAFVAAVREGELG